MDAIWGIHWKYQLVQQSQFSANVVLGVTAVLWIQPSLPNLENILLRETTEI